jgi:uncharacterized membrane protein YphA (DoxX/SURF4 family)
MFFENKDVLEITAQLVMGGFFIVQATKNAMKPDMVIGRLQTYKFPAPKVVMWFGILMMYTGGALLMIDAYADFGAAILIIFTFTATLIFQRWWTVEDPVRRPYNYLMFFYNVFIMGALLLLI